MLKGQPFLKERKKNINRIKKLNLKSRMLSESLVEKTPLQST